jgi:pimeloyl-ACP methyl ester carboxylesterase
MAKEMPMLTTGRLRHPSRASELVALIPIIMGAALLGVGCAPSGTAGQQPPGRALTPTETPQPGTFYFKSEDGVTLSGHLDGQGRTAVVFSNQIGGDQEVWRTVGAANIVQQVVARGYLALTYEYRGDGQSQGGADPNHDPDLAKDLRAAIGVARAHGATKLVLVGASLGGLVTLKVAAGTPVDAVVVLSGLQGFGDLAVDNTELRAITAPKLFLVSADDPGFATDMQYMYAVVPQPKQLHVYPGRLHGIALLPPPPADDAAPLVLSFIAAAAPA